MKDESKSPKKIFENEIPHLWALRVKYDTWRRMEDKWKSEYISQVVSTYVQNRHIVEYAMRVAAECLIEVFKSTTKIESSYDTGLILTDMAGKRYAVDITLRELS